ncbi:MAG: 16S rRNA (guanine(966)-N(2))-methyltransferase RsmD [Nitrospirae bacterium]|nr:16S rRNA (guanine(966)-N(2))-methyltransferase RsmD [Nitrospirota bacterium]
MTVTKKSLNFRRNALQKRLRPTSAKVRKAIFDIIRYRIVGASFVDLYAGTGTVGFEALSRGAAMAIFVEVDKSRAIIIKENLSKFGLKERGFVIEKKAEEFLKKSAVENRKFDIFFIDPPYFSDEIINILPVIEEKKLLTDGGLVIVEHFFKKKLPEIVGGLKKMRNYRYGDTMLTIYNKENTQGKGRGVRW